MTIIKNKMFVSPLKLRKKKFERSQRMRRIATAVCKMPGRNLIA
jgi:hypothetical protein